MKIQIPEEVGHSPLMGQGGYAVLPDLLEPGRLQDLLEEAVRCSSQAQETWTAHSDAEEERGGNPARRFLTAAGGSLQTALYLSAGMREMLSGIARLPVVPTGEGGTFIYYVRPGDFLTIHRDIVTCDLAVITCLHDDGGNGSGGKLCLYPERLLEPLSAIRAEPAKSARLLRLQPGRTLVLFGGVVPHGVLPVEPGQSRLVSVLCYRACAPGRAS